ncbi:hypothetical protein G7046_g1944 [Stylonectria norvegica]|nr:hypothetical protein G7046_g1944 [Stylonectria norvegica]
MLRLPVKPNLDKETAGLKPWLQLKPGSAQYHIPPKRDILQSKRQLPRHRIESQVDAQPLSVLRNPLPVEGVAAVPLCHRLHEKPWDLFRFGNTGSSLARCQALRPTRRRQHSIVMLFSLRSQCRASIIFRSIFRSISLTRRQPWQHPWKAGARRSEPLAETAQRPWLSFCQAISPDHELVVEQGSVHMFVGYRRHLDDATGKRMGLDAFNLTFSCSSMLSSYKSKLIALPLLDGLCICSAQKRHVNK